MKTYPELWTKTKDVSDVFDAHNKTLTCYCDHCKLYRFRLAKAIISSGDLDDKKPDNG